MSDDHAAQAISSYSGRINETPFIDRLAEEGIQFENTFCTNAICAPSRATILSGKHSHKNGVETLNDDFDGRQEHVGKLLQDAGYETSIIGKWHLGHGGHADPTGFDHWSVLRGQGDYHDPVFYDQGERIQYKGYATDIITDLSLEWLDKRKQDKPFFLMLHHKAPHRPWEPDEKHANMYEDIDIPEPENLFDDYESRSDAANTAHMKIAEHLNKTDVKVDPPKDLEGKELTRWYYQRYIKDYLRCIASVDDNVGRVLDYLEENNLADNTMIIYTSDQGFFLGEHGWYDKRFMYEESLRMPFLVRYPDGIKAGSITEGIAVNTDFAPTFLDYAGAEIPDEIQGVSLRPLFEGKEPEDWRESMYYRYWMAADEHVVAPHFGVRTKTHKLICYYGPGLHADGSLPAGTEDQEWPQWELFDLEKDIAEMHNVYDDSTYQEIVEDLKKELIRLKKEFEDEDGLEFIEL